MKSFCKEALFYFVQVSGLFHAGGLSVSPFIVSCTEFETALENLKH
jgi:hypothetical protein